MSRLTTREMLTAHRLEFPFWVNTLCQALWGASFAVAATSGLLALPALLAVAANLVVITGGLLLNTVVDLPNDSRHAERERLTGAARRLGRRTGFVIAISELGSGIAISVGISVWTGRWLVAAAAGTAVALHVLYNIEPFRFKRRGYLGAATFGTAVIAMPFLVAYASVRSDIEVSAGLVFVGLTALTVGRVAWWSVPDLAADAASGLATPSVRHGAMSTLRFAGLTTLAGIGMLGSGLAWSFGILAALIGTAAYVVSFATAAGEIMRARAGVAVSSRRLQQRAMPAVMVGDVILVAVPLVMA